MKGLKHSGIKVEAGTKVKLWKMNSELCNFFSIIELGDVPGGNNLQTQ